MDVISLYSRGIKNVISNCGTAITESQINLIWKFFSDPIIFIIIFNILFRASFNKIVATIYLSSNLLFLKNVENYGVIFLISNQSIVMLGVFKCHKCVPIVWVFIFHERRFSNGMYKKECP